MPTDIDITMTANVSFIVSARVGHVTFLSSANTSLKNLVGTLFGRVGTFGLSITNAPSRGRQVL